MPCGHPNSLLRHGHARATPHFGIALPPVWMSVLAVVEVEALDGTVPIPRVLEHLVHQLGMKVYAYLEA